MRVDISGEPFLVRLVEEAKARRASVLLQLDSEDVAILTPAKTARKRSGKSVTSDDALFGLIGIGSSGIPGGVSGDKHEAIRRAERSL